MKARPVIAERTYLFTRRCSERRFLLRPDDMTNQLYWYCLGYAAQKHNISLHAAVAMSNHSHLVATDAGGTYPNFLRDFHALLARSLNAHRGRWEHFWNSSQTSAVRLADEEAQFDKLIYVLTNPVGLVQEARHWPGATSIKETLSGKELVVMRPPQFFREESDGGAMPESITIRFVPPPALARMERSEYLKRVSERISEVEKQKAAERAKRGVKVLGRRAVRDQRWSARPRNAEPRRTLSPSVACRDKWRRIEILARKREFEVLYTNALEAFKKGLRAVFPLGTWRMRWCAAIEIGQS